MQRQRPQRWLVLKIDEIYKVFGVWYGGYTSSASWRLNSGVTAIEKEGDFIRFYGRSGSIYECHVEGYGTSGYGAGVLESLKELGDFEIISEEEALNLCI